MKSPPPHFCPIPEEKGYHRFFFPNKNEVLTNKKGFSYNITQRSKVITLDDCAIDIFSENHDSLLGTSLPGFRSCIPSWLRLSERPWDPKPLRKQSLSPWQVHHLCPLHPSWPLVHDWLANDG